MGAAVGDRSWPSAFETLACEPRAKVRLSHCRPCEAERARALRAPTPVRPPWGGTCREEPQGRGRGVKTAPAMLPTRPPARPRRAALGRHSGRPLGPTGLCHRRPVPFRPPSPRDSLPVLRGRVNKVDPEIPSPWRTRSVNSCPPGKGRAGERDRGRRSERVPNRLAAGASRDRASAPASATR